MRLRFCLFAVLPLLVACAAPRRAAFFQKLKTEIETDSTLTRAFTGIAVADAETGKILCQSNADKLFIPASNTKILTLYTCLKMLGDSLPALKFKQMVQPSSGKTFLVVSPSADPTFLHPQFQAWQRGFDFLKNCPDSLVWIGAFSEEKRFGPGWAWDDFEFGFQPEKCTFPIYGNLAQFTQTDRNPSVQPQFFQKNLQSDCHLDAPAIVRNELENQWIIGCFTPKDWTAAFPFRPTQNLDLLADTLKRGFSRSSFPEGLESLGPAAWQTLRSCPLDTVLRRMMHQSDNFIGEQLLLVAAGEKFRNCTQDKLLRWAKDSLLAPLPDSLRWVDGSGLSRYNLNSPRNFVEILRRLCREQPRERLFRLFPAGGRDGTLANWFGGADGKPYVFAKSGSISGVFCLSGYLVARSGRVLTFSIMHQNFTGTNRPWKVATQRILEEIRAAN